jgi:hypothetical protein
MRIIITSIVFVLAFSMNAQLVVDDFTTGPVDKLTYVGMTDHRTLLSGSTIIGKYRQIYSKVNQNPYKQNMQLSIKKGLLVLSYAFDTRGTTYVNYGVGKKGNAPLNLNLSTYKSLKVEFEAKSTINGINLNLFTGTTYAAYGKHVPAREGTFVFTIPFSEIKPTGDKFTYSDIDYIRLQFDSRSKTGCNMAINKIWFE